MASARDEAALDRIVSEVRDRYGPPPASIETLADYGRLRVRAERLGVESVDREGDVLAVKFRNDARIEPSQLMRLVQGRPDLKLVPPGILRLERAPATRPPAPAARPSQVPAVPGASTVRPGRAARTTKPVEDTSASWWTSRATAGAVTPGFSREAILRPAKVDPRAPGGLFDRLGGLLDDLSRSAGLDVGSV